MIKIKIEDKDKYLKYRIKSKNYSNLEAIVLLDAAVDILGKDFNLSDIEIWELLKEYRSKFKEKESD